MLQMGAGAQRLWAEAHICELLPLGADEEVAV